MELIERMAFFTAEFAEVAEKNGVINFLRGLRVLCGYEIWFIRQVRTWLDVLSISSSGRIARLGSRRLVVGGF